MSTLSSSVISASNVGRSDGGKKMFGMNLNSDMAPKKTTNIKITVTMGRRTNAVRNPR